MNEERKGLPQRYVNTPFAYMRAQKGFSLLQQTIMMKAAEYLRVYLEKYFQSPALMASNDTPKPIMTAEDLAALPPMRIRFDSLGIPANTYGRARDALKGIFSTMIDVPGFDKDGNPTITMKHLFSAIDLPVKGGGVADPFMYVTAADALFDDVQIDRTRGYFDLVFDKDTLRDILDMSQGYITHPDNITRIGRVPNMPLVYYFVRHKMQNFKINKAQVTPNELREYLGMLDRNPYGEVVKVRYKEYRRLKAQVIKVALDDIKRVYDAGQIDFYFEMKEIRTDGRKTGDPNFLEFRKVGNAKKEDAKYRANSEKKLSTTLLAQYPTLDAKTLRTIFASVPQEQWDDFKGYAYNGVPKAVEQPHRWNGTHEDFVYFLMRSWIKERKTAEPAAAQPQAAQPGANEWRAFMAGYNGLLKEHLAPAEFVSLDDNGTLTLRLSAAEWEALSEKEADIPPISVQSFYHHLTLALGRKVAKIQYDIR